MAQTLWVVGSVPFHGKRRYSFQKPTQQQAVFAAVEASGKDGITSAGIVAALAAVEFDGGKVGCGAKNVAFYTNRLKKNLNIVQKGSVSAVAPTAKFEDAFLTWLEATENLMVSKAREFGVTDEMRGDFATYNKCKALLVRPGTDGEGRAALIASIKRILTIIAAK